MKFKKWESGRNYGHLDRSEGWTYVNGSLPDGTKVRFSDGDVGTVIHGNFERSLVRHSAPGESGAIWEQAWYPHEILEIEEP